MSCARQVNHVLRSALVLGTVVHHAVHPVEEVVGQGVLSVEDSGSLILGSGSVVIFFQDGGGTVEVRD